MKRILLLFLLALPCFAQITGNITASGSTCATTNACVSQQLSAAAASAGVTISGTWSATLQFEASNDNGATWASVNATPLNSTTAVTSATANGTWRINVSGMTNVRVRGSAYASGTAQVTITFGSGSASTGSGGGGGGTPAGSNTQIQYNNAGAFGGDSGCTTNGTGTLTCTSFLGALTGNVTGNASGSSGSTTGNAATATNFDHTPTKCSAGNYPLGIDAHGDAQSCTAASGGGTVTVVGGGSLTNLALVIGGGSQSVQTATGTAFDATNTTLTLGAGSVTARNYGYVVAKTPNGVNLDTGGFFDETAITLATDKSYSSFGSETNFTGTAASTNGHFAAFESQGSWGMTTKLSNYFGYSDNFAVSGGGVHNAYSIYIWPGAGSAAVDNKFGIYISDFTQGSTKYAVVDDCKSCVSYHANSMSIGAQQNSFALTSDMLTVFGHFGIGPFAALAANKPTMGTCGTSPSVVGADSAGLITVGSGTVTGCALNFKTAFNIAPACTASASSAVALSASATTTVLTITTASDVGGGTISYHCTDLMSD